MTECLFHPIDVFRNLSQGLNVKIIITTGRKVESVKQEKIILAAFEALNANGLPALSYDKIAEQSGISRQLIRYYFPDKDDLMSALCNLTGVAYRESLVELASNPNHPDRLKMIFDFSFDLIEEKRKPRDDQVYDAMFSLATSSDFIRESLRAQYNLLGNVVAHEIKIKFPQMRISDADQVSFLFVCLLYGHWKMVASLGLSEDHKYVTRRAMDRIVKSYLDMPENDREPPTIWGLE